MRLENLASSDALIEEGCAGGATIVLPTKDSRANEIIGSNNHMISINSKLF